MGTPLSEMSMEELWELFPIQLTAHQDCWKEWYQAERAYLLPILPHTAKIHHIGSTSINGIWAKPTVDILVESNLNDFKVIKNALIKHGYLCMSQTEIRIDFNKGYTPNGFAEKVFHLHLRVFGDNGELYFRDYLNEHQDVAKLYEKLKLFLWKRFEHDRDSYTNSKAAFICKYTHKAILQYGELYK